MELHRQACQKCGCRKMVNILARVTGENDKVYVQCADCKELVARYIIAQGGYYHHGKGFESYLHGLNRGGHYESTRELRDGFEQLEKNCESEYEEIVEQMGKK